MRDMDPAVAKQQRLALAFAQLDRLAGFYPRVEGKALALFAVDGAMLALVAVNVPWDKIVSAPVGLAGITSLFLGMSLWQVFRAFFPDTRQPRVHSLIFFGDIARRQGGDYRQAFEVATDDELLDDAACQIHRNAEILAAKYEAVKSAASLIACAVPWWLWFLATVAATGELKVSG